jgi:hypothetical protein
MDKIKNIRKKNFTWIWLLVPPVVFYALFFRYTVDIPVNDDYRAILQFMNTYLETLSFFERLKLIFSQHNEHRIVYDRLWVLINYALAGKINFNFLCLIGNLSLTGIFYILSLRLRQLAVSWIYFIPVSVLIFNIAFWENMTFAMAGMSNFTVFLFVLLSLYFLTEDATKAKHIFLSIFFMIAAVFTQGGGIFAVPVSIFILLIKKQYKYAIIYFACSAVILFLFFYRYVSPSYHPDVINTLINYKIKALLFAFSFLGNAFNYFLIYTNDQDKSIGLAGLLGFGLLIVFLYIIKTKYYRKNLFVFSIMLLMVIVAFVTGINRCQMGLETSGASRYRINGVIFVIALYYWLIETQQGKIHKGIIIAFSVFYFLCISLSHYEYLQFRMRSSLLGALTYEVGDYSKLNGFEQEEYHKILARSKKNGIYKLTEEHSLGNYFPYSRSCVLKEYAISPSNLRFSVDEIIKTRDAYLLDGWAFLEGRSTWQQSVYIGLKPDSLSPVFFSAKQETRYDLNPYFHKFNLSNGGFVARIKFKDLPKGNLHILIRVMNDNETKISETGKILNN